MRAFRRLCAAVVILFIVLAAAVNITLINNKDDRSGIYRVEAKRLAEEISSTGSYDIKKYPHITGVFTGENIYQSDEQYVICEIKGELYRIEYRLDEGVNELVIIDLALGAMLLGITGLLIFFHRQIIAPFGKLNEVPKELARGNLSVPIPEEKSRFLGKFTWGVNLLREKIEEDRQKEITMQKDKKLLLLSLSHDIKTPLSAIKLNAKALATGLYKDEEKRRSAAESINSRANEIEGFVSQITKAASEDFMNFEVHMDEVFLSQVIQKISLRYSVQLAATNTEFAIDSFDDCILSCDPDRLGECLQNLMENAIKYGDGRRIGISFERMDGCELITLSNTGCTLDEKELVQIFESFHRGSNVGNARGNGLGLFICKRLMSLMGGEVYAAVQEGCFQVTLVVRLA